MRSASAQLIQPTQLALHAYRPAVPPLTMIERQHSLLSGSEKSREPERQRAAAVRSSQSGTGGAQTTPTPPPPPA